MHIFSTTTTTPSCFRIADHTMERTHHAANSVIVGLRTTHFKRFFEQILSIESWTRFIMSFGPCPPKIHSSKFAFKALSFQVWGSHLNTHIWIIWPPNQAKNGFQAYFVWLLFGLKPRVFQLRSRTPNSGSICCTSRSSF